MRLSVVFIALLCGLANAQPNPATGSDWLKQLAQNASGNTEEFLPADEAFQLFDLSNTDGSITLEWVIQPGYYLYQHSLKAVDPAQPANSLIDQEKLSPGQWFDDPEFGRVRIYSELAKTQIQPSAGMQSVEIHYQGCAKAGLCYPPQKKTIQLAEVASSTTATLNAHGSHPMPWAKRLSTEKLNVVWVHADWCGPCRQMQAAVFPAHAIQQLLAEVHWLEWDVTDIDANEALLAELQLPGPPALLFIDRKGKLMPAGKLIGSQSINSVESALNRAIAAEANQPKTQSLTP